MPTNPTLASEVSVKTEGDGPDTSHPPQNEFGVLESPDSNSGSIAVDEDGDPAKQSTFKIVSQACTKMPAAVTKALADIHKALEKRWKSLRPKLKPVHGLIAWWHCNLLFGIPYWLFIYGVLIRGHIKVCGTVFNASTANLLVSILSAILATFVDAMLREYLNVVRFKLAARKSGTRNATFHGIGPASQWKSTAYLVVACRAFNVLMAIRLALPLLVIANGAVLKINANFETKFVSFGTQLPVYAGLIPMDDRLVNNINVTDLCQFFSSWTSSLQGSSRYAVRTSFKGCGTGCRALLWPGGMETVRQAGPSANYSVFHGGHFDAVPAVRIENAPGFITTFSTPPRDFVFGEDDCWYGGSLSNDSLKMCARQTNDGVTAGWTACPQRAKDSGRCDVDTAWKQAAMNSMVRINAYRQYTSTIYDQRNLSIIHSEPRGKPQPITLQATQYRNIFRKALVPKPGASLMDNSTVATLGFNLGWMHRTFTEVFPDNTGTITTALENILAIPLQWSITAHQYANYTHATNGLSRNAFPMPAYMLTVAQGGSSVQRFAIQAWTGGLFIATHVTILLFILGNIIWITGTPRLQDGIGGFPDLEMLNTAHAATLYKVKKHASFWLPQKPLDEQEYESKALLSDLASAVQSKSSWQAAKTLKDWRVQVKAATS